MMSALSNRMAREFWGCAGGCQLKRTFPGNRGKRAPRLPANYAFYLCERRPIDGRSAKETTSTGARTPNILPRGGAPYSVTVVTMKDATVGELMTRQVYAVGVETARSCAARTMLERGITGCPVVDWKGRALGIVSLTDIVDPDRRTSTTPGVDVHFQIEDGRVIGFGTGTRVPGGSVDELMTAATISLHPEDSIEDAAELMVFNRIHRVLVTHDERVVGMISTMDIARHFLDVRRHEADARQAIVA